MIGFFTGYAYKKAVIYISLATTWYTIFFSGEDFLIGSKMMRLSAFSLDIKVRKSRWNA